MSWKELGIYYEDPNRVRPLPFAIDRVSRAIDALVHNFEKYSKPGESCELRVRETSACFEMLWRVWGPTPAFPDFQSFCKKVVDPLWRGKDHGVHRGLPLALMFGLESGASRIGVWIGDGRQGQWHDVVGERFEEAPTMNTTYAIGWRWSFQDSAETK